MRKNLFKLLAIVIIVLILILSGCSNLMPTVTNTSTPSNSSTPSPTFTPTIVPTPTRPSIPAPVIPVVSAAISIENVNKLQRLTSLGEGDLLNSQLSPDGKWVILGTQTGILVLDSSTLKKVMFLPTAITPEIITFFENGKKLSARDDDYYAGGTQRYVWSFPDGQELSHMYTHYYCIDSTGKNNHCFSFPDKNYEYAFNWGYNKNVTGSLFATYGTYTYSYRDAVAGVYRISDGVIQYMVNYRVNSFAVSPDNKLLVLGTEENKLVFMQYQDGKLLAEIPERGVKSIFFYPDGKTVAVILGDQIKLYNTTDFQFVDSINSSGIQQAAFSPDNSVIVLWGPWNSTEYARGRMGQVYRVEDRKNIGSIFGTGVIFRSDGLGLIVNIPGKIKKFQYYSIYPDRSKLEGKTISNGEILGSSSISSDNSKIIIRSFDGEYSKRGLFIYNIDSDSITQTFSIYPDLNCNMNEALWLPSFQTFGILGNVGGEACFDTLDLTTGSFTKYIDQKSSRKQPYLVFSPENNTLISVTNGKALSWDFDNNLAYTDGLEVYHHLDWFEEDESTSPDGKYQAQKKMSGDDYQGMDVLYDGEIVFSVGGEYRNFSFSPDSKMIAMTGAANGGWGGWVNIYNLSTGETIFSSGLTNQSIVPLVTFSSDGKYLAVLTSSAFPQVWGIP